MKGKELLSLFFGIYGVCLVECNSSESEQNSDIVYLFNHISGKNETVQKIFFNTTLNRLVSDPENDKVRFFS